jgi:hypothetical protein
MQALDLLLNPDLFSIEQAKGMGMWPPSDIVAHGILPYIKRMKHNNIHVLDVGVMKGENAMYLLEKDEGKIDEVYGIESFASGKSVPEYEKLLHENTKNESRFVLWDNSISGPFDVVCIHSNSAIEDALPLYYNMVKSNGIFCGNEHHLPHVKDALFKFRREAKIGTPINVSNSCWFWWKR